MNQKSLMGKTKKVFGFAKNINKILIINTSSQDPNFIYMTDFSGGLFESSFLLVERKKATLFTYSLEYEIAKQQAPKSMKVINLNSKEKFELLKKEVKGIKIGVNESFIPYRTYKNIKKRLKPRRIVDVSAAFEKAREIKTDREIKQIGMAAKITKKAIAEAQKTLKIGITEKEVATNFENATLRLGADDLAFGSIVCFGKNAALPHHNPDNTKLKKGDFVLIDVGAKVGNYCADITRTIIFGKDKDYAEKLKILNIVKDAQKKAIAQIKEGAIGGNVHLTAQKYIDGADKGEYKGTFIHSLGHSIGIEVHDGSGGFLSPGSKLVLKEGMVTSVEPGIYLPGFGGVRFEDDILVTKKGAIIL